MIGVAAEGPARPLRIVLAPVFTVLATIVFVLVLWANSGPVDDNSCDVYCGPTNLLVATGLLVLFPIAWVGAAVTTVVVAFARPRRVALVCALVLLVPVVVLTWMYVSTH